MISRGFSEPTDRVKRLKKAIVDAIPYVESERAVLVTESYKETEGLSPIMRRAKAAEKIFNNLPITIHEQSPRTFVLQKSARSFPMTGLKKSSIPWEPEWLTRSRFRRIPPMS